ncbi:MULTISPECIES: Tat pathway signal sequence domain protein [unclassified Streptomyces]|uniref:Tat pathway signal sequence domain protein n=1 Tax=unclassified Streptomyces TaxID=2593676 RepID=UPI001CB6DC35|nr:MULTISPECIES: Tat pathway signal sequence domain protein [unclassified Streptomyces]
MRRTGLSALAVACTAVLAGAAPAFADGGSGTPSPVPTVVTDPSAAPSEASPVPSEASPVPEEATDPSAAPAEEPSSGQVSVVPSGAPDTGVAGESSGEGGGGSGAALVGGGAAAAVALGGGAFVLLRRRTNSA